MARFSVQSRDRVFVNGYGFLSFAKNMGKNIGNHISKSLTGKYIQKRLDDLKQSETDALTDSSKRVIQKTEEVSRDLIEKKIANRITKVSKISQQNISKAVTNEYYEKIILNKIISRKKKIIYW